MKRSLLILGGTGEARQLAGLLAAEGFDCLLSLAGRTSHPIKQPVPVRIGGFGGAEGLAAFITAQGIDMLLDATHPYAARMSANAVMAARMTQVPFLALRRPGWLREDGDLWHEVADAGEAVRSLGETPKRVFVALGRKDLAPLEQAPQHRYLIRSVDPVDPPLRLPHASYITATGPFGHEDELALLKTRGIEAVISKNSGGAAAYGKIAAARELRLPVIMIARPDLPEAPSVDNVPDMVEQVRRHFEDHPRGE